jgi:hypothetical protein
MTHDVSLIMRDWLEDTAATIPDPVGIYPAVAGAVHTTPQQQRWLPALPGRRSPSVTTFSSVMVAGLAAILLGGFLYTSGPGRTEIPGPMPAAAALTASAPASPATAASSLEPTTDASAAPTKAVAWEDRGVRFEADGFTIRTNGRVYRDDVFRAHKVPEVSGYHESQRAAEIEGQWKEFGTNMRLRFDLRADDTHWWISRIKTYDGVKDDGHYLTYGGLKDSTRTPRGEAFEGDLKLDASSGFRDELLSTAQLQIDGMVLEAFPLELTIPPPPSRIPFEDMPMGEVTFENALMLPGQVQIVTAQLGTMGECEDAELVRWRVENPNRGKINPSRGARVRLKARDIPGGLGIRIGGTWGERPDGSPERIVYATSATVRPFPGESTAAWRQSRRGDSSVYPEEQVLRVGQHVVLTGWKCPSNGSRRFGKDRRPGTSDDRCEVSPIVTARPLPGSGMTHVGMFGPSTLMRVDAFVDLGDDLNAVGVWVRYGDESSIDIELPWLYARNDPWQGPKLGDIDADGDIDIADLDVISAVLVAAESVEPGDPTWDKALDVNADRVIDSVDLEILYALIEARAAR